MQSRDLGEFEHLPRRVLIVDGDMALMRSLENILQDECPGVAVDVFEEDEPFEFSDDTYDLVIMDDYKVLDQTMEQHPKFLQQELVFDPAEDNGQPVSRVNLKGALMLGRVRQHSPDADYILLTGEEDPARLTNRTREAIQEGALHFLPKPKGKDAASSTELVRSILTAYMENQERILLLNEDPSSDIYAHSERIVEKLMHEKPRYVEAIEGKLADAPVVKSNLVRSLEERVDEVLKRELGELDEGDFALLDSLITPEAGKINNQVILAKLALMAFYQKGSFQEAIEHLTLALSMSSEDKEQQDEVDESVRMIRGQIVNDFGTYMLKQSQRDFESGVKSSVSPELFEQVERTAEQLNLKDQIRPTRGNVAIVPVGHTLCYRREDPDEASIRNEVSRYRFYARVTKHMQRARNLLIIPEVFTVTKSYDDHSWVMYRKYVKGTGALDELRKLQSDLRRFISRGSKEYSDDIERVKSQKSHLLMKLVEQCAYVLAFGPTGLADDVPKPMKTYYAPRLEERILNPFNALFSKTGVAGISATDRARFIDAMEPIHEHLEGLEPVFYKDSWYANSVILRRGKGVRMYVHDFASVKKLPIAVDLATQLCYGEFVSQKISRNDPFEQALIEHFLNTYSDGVEDFSKIVSLYEQDRQGFIIGEITDDISEGYPGETSAGLMALREHAVSTDFTDVDKAFAELRRKVKADGVEVSPAYFEDLESFADNLRGKTDPLQGIADGSETYTTTVQDFMTDTYAGLAHRALLMAGTHASFVREHYQQIPDKKRVALLSEMIHTLQNALRGVSQAYTRLGGEDGRYVDQKEDATRIVRMLQNKIKQRVYTGR